MGQAKNRRRNEQEYIKALQESMSKLIVSCNTFDRGKEWEAARIATEVINLCHDGVATSILASLNLKRRMRFFGITRPVGHRNLMDDFPLVITSFGNASAQYKPCLSNGPEEFSQTTFAQWWSGPILRRSFQNVDFFEKDNTIKAEYHGLAENMLKYDAAPNKKNLISGVIAREIVPGFTVSRKDVASDMRNAEGGHISRDLTETMDWFHSSGASPFVYGSNEGELPIKGTLYAASVRHIAHELVVSFSRGQLPYLPADILSDYESSLE